MIAKLKYLLDGSEVTITTDSYSDPNIVVTPVIEGNERTTNLDLQAGLLQSLNEEFFSLKLISPVIQSNQDIIPKYAVS